METAFAGPPFLTDDPEPVPFKHWEAYLFSAVDDKSKGWESTTDQKSGRIAPP